MGRRFFIYSCLFFFIVQGFGPGLIPRAGASPAITLKSAEIEKFAVSVPAENREVKASFKDRPFSLKEAVNLREVYELVGPLTAEQEHFLEKNRFLLLPKSKMMLFPPPATGPHDEMLANFDALGGATDEDFREPWNARFIGPDVFLHAFYKYSSIRLAALETDSLRAKVRYLLEGLFLNAQTLKGLSGGRAAKNWERLMAQMALPMVLLNGWDESGKIGGGEAEERAAALALFEEKYSLAFSPPTAKNIRAELRRIYKASGRESCLLGLSPVANPGGLVDYSLFSPRGHYINDPRLRAYYRAMVWLGALGWSAANEESLADALNWALAMSYEAPPKPGGKPVAAPAGGAANEAVKQEKPALTKVWAEIMALNAFFLGYHQSPSYTEWLPFLMKEAGVPGFTADMSSEGLVLENLKAGFGALKPRLPYFPALKAPT